MNNGEFVRFTARSPRRFGFPEQSLLGKDHHSENACEASYILIRHKILGFSFNLIAARFNNRSSFPHMPGSFTSIFLVAFFLDERQQPVRAFEPRLAAAEEAALQEAQRLALDHAGVLAGNGQATLSLERKATQR